MKTFIPTPPEGKVLVYKYGIRIDKDCLESFDRQIFMARRLYNDVIACIRKCVDARAEREFELAGEQAKGIKLKIDALNDQFNVAKAANDENAMTAIATIRRQEWSALALALKEVRAKHKAELKTYFTPIGTKSTCETYQLRCKYVEDGLGWATANQVLDRALNAFQSTIKRGQAPRFAIGAEIDRDTLCLQFTAAGGIPAEKLLAGAHSECQLHPPVGGFAPRKYGEFRFRLGAAKADQWASGTWQAHRPIPENASVAGVTIVRDRLGHKFTYNVQLLLKLKERMLKETPAIREPLGVLHLGWSADSDGRRIAGWATGADAGLAQLLQLPPEVEQGLQKASETQSTRSQNRDKIVAWLKELPVAEVASWTSEDQLPIAEEFKAIRRLPATHVSQSRLHRFWWRMHKNDLLNDKWTPFSQWRSVDKTDHQTSVHAAKRARNLRKDFYRKIALKMCRHCESIVIDAPDLSEAAVVISKSTGERNELSKKSRAGRVIAALYELINSVKWAAARCDTVVIETGGDTASICSTCGASGLQTVEGTQFQQQTCPDCGALHDRKLNAAAATYQRIYSELDDLRVEHTMTVDAARQQKANKLIEKNKAIRAARLRNSELTALAQSEVA